LRADPLFVVRWFWLGSGLVMMVQGDAAMLQLPTAEL
jgi:hypothetical protein